MCSRVRTIPQRDGQTDMLNQYRAAGMLTRDNNYFVTNKKNNFLPEYVVKTFYSTVSFMCCNALLLLRYFERFIIIIIIFISDVV